MDGSIFFPLGGALVLAALVLSAIGIRGRDSFPPSRPVMIGLTLLFAAVVIGTTSLAVVNAREEKDHRNEELAEEEKAAEEEAAAGQPAVEPGGGGGGAPPPSGGAAPPGGATALDVTSPEDGSLVFEPDGLEAKAGPVTITYSNPSPVDHSLAVEGGDGTILGETEIFTAGEQEVSIEDLAPGEYVFFCTVPGHREGGMEGDLTVQ